LRALVSFSIARKSAWTGLLMPEEKRGFCRKSAASSVEPERGSPDMKCRRFCIKGMGPRKGDATRAARRYSAVAEARQAGDVLRLRVCASQPRPAKPASIIAQVEGSGTAGVRAVMLIEPSPRFTPAVRT
jgi:hypothetical protein